MIIKSKDFDRIFQEKLKQIKLGRIYVSSKYVNMDHGLPIVNIDILSYVKYDGKLQDRIRKVFKDMKYFLLIDIGCGYSQDCFWTIDNNGSCDFDPNRIESWLKKIEPILSRSSFEKVTNLLSRSISLHNLITAEDIIKEETKLNWSLRDLYKRQIEVNNTIYFFAIKAQTDQPVIRLIYEYEGKFCLIKYTLIDEQHQRKSLLPKFYIHDWFEVAQKMEQHALPKHKKDYNKDLKEARDLNLLLDQIKLHNLVKKYFPDSPLDKKVSYNTNWVLGSIGLTYNAELKCTLKENIRYMISTRLPKLISYLDGDFRDRMNTYLQRSWDAQILVPVIILKKRFLEGRRCPFFSLNVKDFSLLIKISKEKKINFDRLQACVINVSQSNNVTVSQVVQLLSNLDLVPPKKGSIDTKMLAQEFKVSSDLKYGYLEKYGKVSVHVEYDEKVAETMYTNYVITSHIPFSQKMYRTIRYDKGSIFFLSLIKNKLSSKNVNVYIRDCLIFLSQLNQKGYCHLDIRPENLGTSSKNMLIVGNYGSMSRTSSPIEYKGVFPYIAPEIEVSSGQRQLLSQVTSLGIPINNKYFYYFFPQNDVWSLGITILKLYRIKIDENNYDLNKIHQCNYNIDEDVRTLLRFMLNPNPAKRPTPTELLEVI